LINPDYFKLIHSFFKKNFQIFIDVIIFFFFSKFHFKDVCILCMFIWKYMWE